MADGIVLFKTEAKRIEKVRNALKNSTRLNGSQVILGETNQANLREVIAHLEKAAAILRDIT